MEEEIGEMSKGSNLQKAATAIGMTFGMKAFKTVLESIISVDNYVVLSLTRATFQGESRIIGIGAFGNVFMVKGIEEGLFQLQKRGVNEIEPSLKHFRQVRKTWHALA